MKIDTKADAVEVAREALISLWGPEYVGDQPSVFEADLDALIEAAEQRGKEAGYDAAHDELSGPILTLKARAEQAEAQRDAGRVLIEKARAFLFTFRAEPYSSQSDFPHIEYWQFHQAENDYEAGVEYEIAEVEP